MTAASELELIDWRLAAATARQLVPAGPQVTPAEARAAVAELRELAVSADEHVRAFTGLDPGSGAGRILVVDRPGWVTANVEGFRVVLAPFLDRLAAKRKLPGPLAVAVGSRLTALELGSLLAFLATKVLGQYEVFLPPDQGPGRLTLVAPNIVATEQALGVDRRDFRLWVCLHEMAHRTQFSAVPWLRAHLQDELAAYVDALELEPLAVLRRLVGGLARIVGSRGPVSLIELVQSPAQRLVLDRITGLMSLLEGHAEFVMDGVGPQVVPSVGEIRRRFDARRADISPFDRVIRQLLGLDAKMRQYSEGSAFVRHVVDRVGLAEFNRIWTGPSTLPSRAEIRDPDAWIARVLAG